jgi:hypothetical protein
VTNGAFSTLVGAVCCSAGHARALGAISCDLGLRQRQTRQRQEALDGLFDKFVLRFSLLVVRCHELFDVTRIDAPSRDTLDPPSEAKRLRFSVHGSARPGVLEENSWLVAQVEGAARFLGRPVVDRRDVTVVNVDYQVRLIGRLPARSSVAAIRERSEEPHGREGNDG